MRKAEDVAREWLVEFWGLPLEHWDDGCRAQAQSLTALIVSQREEAEKAMRERAAWLADGKATVSRAYEADRGHSRARGKSFRETRRRHPRAAYGGRVMCVSLVLPSGYVLECIGEIEKYFGVTAIMQDDALPRERHVDDECLCSVDLGATLAAAGWIVEPALPGDDPMELRAVLA